ncbi:hypothetical protein CsSME_00031949 [Camellia sinensis var. sinensis]
MVKGVSTQSVVKSFSAILKMDGDMAIFFVSMLTEQGGELVSTDIRSKYSLRMSLFVCTAGFNRCLEIWDEGVLVSRKQLDSDDAGAE